MRIGFRRSKSGKRERAFFYLGKDENEAVAQAVQKKLEWKQLRRAFKARPAVWNDEDVPVVEGMSEVELEAERTRILLEAMDDMEEQVPRPRFSQVRDRYLEYRKGKIGVGGGQGIKQGAYNAEEVNLRAAGRATDRERL